MKIASIYLAFTTSAAMTTAALAASHVDNPHDQGHPTTRAEMGDRCSILQTQYEAMAGAHTADPRYEVASGLHAAGVTACQSNQSDVGIEKLEQALRAIGVEPKE